MKLNQIKKTATFIKRVTGFYGDICSAMDLGHRFWPDIVMILSRDAPIPKEKIRLQISDTEHTFFEGALNVFKAQKSNLTKTIQLCKS